MHIWKHIKRDRWQCSQERACNVNAKLRALKLALTKLEIQIKDVAGYFYNELDLILCDTKSYEPLELHDGYGLIWNDFMVPSGMFTMFMTRVHLKDTLM